VLVEKSSRTKCRKVFKEMLTEPALKCWHHRLMWLLSKRPLGRSSTRRLCAAVGQKGTKKQRAAFMLAKWFFDTGDRVGLATL
jgi:hypothetical protein